MTFARRAEDLRELMDDPDCDPDALRRTLVRFGLVNRVVSRWGVVYRRHLAARMHGRVRVLDVGCGGGDVLRRVVARGRATGAEVTGVGVDLDARAIDVARTRGGDGVRFECVPAEELAARGDAFDVVISNHVLHHLPTATIPDFLETSARLAPGGIVVHADLARSRVAHAAYAVLVTPVAAGTFLRTDGLRSIRRAFRADELRALVPSGWRVETAAPYRLLAVAEPPA